MSIPDGAYAQKEFEKNFLQMQGNIENVDFGDYPEIENFLNFSLENIDDLQLRTRFKFDYYDNLEAIRTKKITPRGVLDKYLEYTSSSFELDIHPKNVLYIQEKIEPNPENHKNPPTPPKHERILSQKTDTNIKTTKLKQENLIDDFLNDAKIKDEFLKLQTEFQEKKERFEEFFKKYQKLYDINNGLNITSSIFAAASWALFLTYTGLAFWTFGATLPFAAAAALQSSIMTFFVSGSFKAQKAIGEDLKRIKEFKNSSEYQKINKFLQMNFEEFKDELKTKLKNKDPDFIFFYNIINISTQTSAVRYLIKTTIEKVMKVMVSKILGRKITNTVLRDLVTEALFKKAFFSAHKIVDGLKIAGKLKRGVLTTIKYANPLGAIISILDTLVSAISVLTNLVITSQLKNNY